MAAGHVGGGPGSKDENEPFGIQIDLAFEPFQTLFQDVGTVYLDCMASPFYESSPCAQRSDAARQRRRAGRFRPSPFAVLQARCPCARPKGPEYPQRVPQPAGIAGRLPAASGRSRPSRAAAHADEWPSKGNTKPDRRSMAAQPVINRRQKPGTQIHRKRLSHPCWPPSQHGF